MVKEYTEYNVPDIVKDIVLFLIWMIVGVLAGWLIAYIAHPNIAWLYSPTYDYYGMVGAALAALWVNFRRQKHLEMLLELPFVKRHLEKMAAKGKK